MISYASAVAQLYQLGHELASSSGHKFDLELVRVLLAALDHPERRFRPVLVAGTNGKGSTAATLASIMVAAGHRTALYTSPHLLRINERICLNGQEIGNEAFAAVYERVEAAVEELLQAGKLPWHPSFFEVLTAMAFVHFADSSTELAVLEVGMGGRLDATNVVDPVLSILTDISLDHQKFLGNSIREIAGEKVGIMRPGGWVVTLPQHPDANDVIGKAALQCGATVISAVPFVPPGSPGSGSVRDRYSLQVMGREIEVETPLPGRHQWRNLALAIAAAEQLRELGYDLTPENIAEGIRRTRWPGRFQVIPADPLRGTPEIVLDVAHNPAGAWALQAALSDRYAEERRLVFVFGAMRDKAITEIASILLPRAQHLVAVRADNPRSAEPGEIRAVAERILNHVEIANSIPAGLQRAFSLAGREGVVVITGSIYVVGEAMHALEAQNLL